MARNPHMNLPFASLLQACTRAALATMVLWASAGLAWAQDPPADFKVAFIGDQGLGTNAESVLKLVKAEGTQLLVHLGDFDYVDNPMAWEGQTDKILGPDFLQFAVLGNHDEAKWSGTTGYGALIKKRMEKMGVPYVGELGKKCSFKYKGIFFVFTTPGLDGTGHETFIRQQMEQDNSAWRISNWHVNQTRMQAGTKGNEAGWPVYEESRMAGALIATAHEHSYFRTHLLSNMTNQTIVSKDSLMRLKKGQSFAFVSGLAGQSIRSQSQQGEYIASVYTSTQSATYGALFATFNVNGNPRMASFYFKDIKGKIVDRFTVISEVNMGPTAMRVGRERIAVVPGRFGMPADGEVRISDLNGKAVAQTRAVGGDETEVSGRGRAGVLLVRQADGGGTGGKVGKFVVLP